MTSANDQHALKYNCSQPTLDREESLNEIRRMTMKKLGIQDLLQRLHDDEKGGVSLETILIIGAIALPILIFLITIAWPRVKQLFYTGMNDLESGTLTGQQE
jgi:hypothetical protein